ncbi:hypothetical protein EVAR_53226_1 [Eumeta japonica]|uniref:Uncharacterized protein n=1 Tax=Eumeta variegata TaxID=151549 RepID=A0A4C1XBN7_EUMVA|nr:hypothetical protein EVAR_53226_1 [Eumeta japonica]
MLRKRPLYGSADSGEFLRWNHSWLKFFEDRSQLDSARRSVTAVLGPVTLKCYQMWFSSPKSTLVFRHCRRHGIQILVQSMKF